ncbi:hypothetical protein P7K49_003958 [Saguinus oedipus]|uniref:FHA domain-containing protein n=1 Tax=Saguinus oedipus TaxID=9490 RepID=A0ABQ9W612_SAGOE|nr:hypothetical protein P7K49_003958 [Saguinus oedipus]
MCMAGCRLLSAEFSCDGGSLQGRLGINAQARRLQRSRAKGTPAVALGDAQSSPPPLLRRTVSETSLSPATALPATAHSPEEPGPDAMRYSLYQSPHLLLLQGYSQQHDSLVYVLNRDRHTVGQRTPSSKPSIILSAPDILPLHCTIRRHPLPDSGQARGRLVLEPIPGAPISVNFSEVGRRTVVLHHGDLLSLGLYYLLLFKDPAQAQPLPAHALARLRAVPQSCRLCGAVLGARGATSPTQAALPRRQQLLLEFEPQLEDTLLQRIMTLIEPGGDDHKLTPAFLLCLCIQHSATHFEPGTFGQLLLKIARLIRETVWVSVLGWAVCVLCQAGGKEVLELAMAERQERLCLTPMVLCCVVQGGPSLPVAASQPLRLPRASPEPKVSAAALRMGLVWGPWSPPDLWACTLPGVPLGPELSCAKSEVPPSLVTARLR